MQRRVPRHLSDLTALADPVRRRLYEAVADRHAPVGRDEAAEATGITRRLAAYHLDRLAEAGLLAISYARPEGRTGPGAGRPAKRYEPVDDEVSMSLPARDYVLLAHLLAEAMDADESGVVRAGLMQAAEHDGEAAVRPDEDLVDVLRDRGYDPVTQDDGDVILRNCPFHKVAQEHTDLVCGLNHSLLRGCLCGAGMDPDRAELSPASGRCCVVIHPESRSATTQITKGAPNVE